MSVRDVMLSRSVFGTGAPSRTLRSALNFDTKGAGDEYTNSQAAALYTR